MREELISVRATEVDEAIASGISGESGVEELEGKMRKTVLASFLK